MRIFDDSWKIISYFLPVMLALIIWEILSNVFLVNPLLYPPPSRLIATLDKLMLNGTLLTNILSSIGRVAIGFILGSLTGISAAMLMIEFKIFNYLFQPFVSLLQPIPKMAWIPLIILWIGLNEQAIIFVIALACFWSVIISSYSGIKSVSKDYIKTGISLGANRISVFFSVILPAAFPSILVGLRLGFASSWRNLVAAEFILASTTGLGFMIFNARQFLRTDEVFVGIFTIGLIFLAIEKLFFRKFEKIIFDKWGLKSN